MRFAMLHGVIGVAVTCTMALSGMARDGMALDATYFAYQTTAYYPRHTLGDVNEDGNLDVILSDPDSTRILLGLGDGRIRPGIVLPVGWIPSTGDLNRDGHLDIVLTLDGPRSSLTVFLGVGDGTFSPPMTQSLGIAQGAPYILDANSDGISDVLVVTSETGVTPANLYLGRGDGTFQAPARIDTLRSRHVVVGNFDGDPHADLAVWAWTTNSYVYDQLQIFHGSPDGWRITSEWISAGWPNNPIGIASGDWNGDGISDIAVLRERFRTWLLDVFLNDTNDGLVPVALALQLPFYSTPSDLVGWTRAFAAGDFDHDGLSDLAVGFRTARSFRSLGNGFEQWNELPLADRFSVHELATGDLNSDGFDDMVSVHAGGLLTIQLGSPSGLGGGLPTPTLIENFEALVDGSRVDLIWRGGSASDIAYVQRYGSSWIEVGMATRTSTGWAFHDDVSWGRHTYRLRVVARDRTFYTEPFVVDVSAPTSSWLGPNPSDGRFQVSFALPRPANVELNLYDMQGRGVLHERASESAGSHQWTLDRRHLPAGVYNVILREGGRDILRSRLVVVR